MGNLINKKVIPTELMGKVHILADELLGIVYPSECPVCQKLLADTRERRMGIHKICYGRMKRVTQPMCLKCGKPLVSRRQEYCFDCVRRPGSYESGHGLWYYDQYSSQAVFNCKYGRKKQYVGFFSGSLVTFYGDWICGLQVQQLVPVPISNQKKRQRGFNQAELLADGIGKSLGIPVNAEGLIRIRSTAPQKELDREARRKNMEQAFRTDPKYFKGIEKVLLIDDIYTTGSTVEYCTRALKKAGVKKVWFLTLCIGGIF